MEDDEEIERMFLKATEQEVERHNTWDLKKLLLFSLMLLVVAVFLVSAACILHHQH